MNNFKKKHDISYPYQLFLFIKLFINLTINFKFNIVTLSYHVHFKFLSI